MQENLTIKLTKLLIEIRKSAFVHGTNVAPVQPIDLTSVEKLEDTNFKSSFIDSYSLSCKYLLSWEENAPNIHSIIGRIKILPLENIIKKQSSSNYDAKYYDDDDPIVDFYVVDEFINEAGVGIYAGKHATNSLYYFDIDERPEYLGLDFLGYLEMATEAKVFIYWQKAILAIRNGKTNPETEQFKLHMPRLFPGWTWEGFVAKYESLKIEEEAY